jgi:RimJ/RimL family protein N-acetyltransferase
MNHYAELGQTVMIPIVMTENITTTCNEKTETCRIHGKFERPAAWGLFCHDVACWQLFGHGGLMIDLQTTGACVGQVGISHGPLFLEKELGWIVYEGQEGQGYATEAAMALRDWAVSTLRLDGLVSYIHPENHRSAAVARRLGAKLDPAAVKQDPGDLVYRHRPFRAAI